MVVRVGDETYVGGAVVLDEPPLLSEGRREDRVGEPPPETRLRRGGLAPATEGVTLPGDEERSRRERLYRAKPLFGERKPVRRRLDDDVGPVRPHQLEDVAERRGLALRPCDDFGRCEGERFDRASRLEPRQIVPLPR